MSWIDNFVRPKIKALVGRPEVPDNLWRKCPGCGQMIFHRDMARHHHVCQHCGHHMRLPVDQRLAMLFDDGEYQVSALPRAQPDPLKFRDRKRYSERLRDARGATRRDDAVVVAHGLMGGRDTVIAAFDFDFMGGSMGVAVGEGIVTAAQLAIDRQAALITIPASGGARMQEGILSLMQLPRTTIAVNRVKDAGLPYLVVLSDPTTGGVTASFAMLGDVHLAEPGAQIGFAGRRVIEQTVRETLPDGFQTAEYLLEHGMVDMVVHRTHLRETLINLIDMLTMPDVAGKDADADAPHDAMAGDEPDPADSGDGDGGGNIPATLSIGDATPGLRRDEP